MSLTAVIQDALKGYLERRGFWSAAPPRPFKITPAEQGSGTNDVSEQHDRYIAGVTARALADAGPLYAALDPSDAHHELAQRDIERLNYSELQVIVAYRPCVRGSH